MSPRASVHDAPEALFLARAPLFDRLPLLDAEVLLHFLHAIDVRLAQGIALLKRAVVEVLERLVNGLPALHAGPGLGRDVVLRPGVEGQGGVPQDRAHALQAVLAQVAGVFLALEPDGGDGDDLVFCAHASTSAGTGVFALSISNTLISIRILLPSLQAARAVSKSFSTSFSPLYGSQSNFSSALNMVAPFTILAIRENTFSPSCTPCDTRERPLRTHPGSPARRSGTPSSCRLLPPQTLLPSSGAPAPDSRVPRASGARPPARCPSPP